MRLFTIITQMIIGFATAVFDHFFLGGGVGGGGEVRYQSHCTMRVYYRFHTGCFTTNSNKNIQLGLFALWKTTK